MSVGIASLPASVLAGYLWESFGAPVALGIGAGFAAIAALVFGMGVTKK